jgi:hypothetical protein
MRGALVAADDNSYMPGAEISKKTVFAGCSSVLVLDGYVPLPDRVSAGWARGLSGTLESAQRATRCAWMELSKSGGVCQCAGGLLM